MSKLTRPPFPLRVTLIFVVLSGLWIILSDRAMLLLTTNTEELAQWQTWKGWAYVGVIAVLLYGALNREDRRRRQSEAALREAEARYRQLFEATPLPCWVYDAGHMTMQMVNTAALRQYGYSEEEFLSLKIQDLHPPEDESFLLDYQAWIVEGNLSAASGRDTVWRQRKKDGTLIAAELTWSLLADRKAVLVVANDITLHRKAEEELQAAQHFTQATLDALTAHLCVLDETGTIVSVNRAWRTFAEANPPVPPRFCLGDNYLEVCDRASGPASAEAAPFAAGIRAVIHGEIDHFIMEYPCHAPQEERWFIGRVTRFAEGDAPCILIVHEDITERRRAELALRESQARFATVFHHAPLAIAISRFRDNQLIDVNDEWQRLTGYTREQAVGHTSLELQVWAEANARARMVEALRERGQVRDFEMQLRHRTGAIATLSMSADLIEIAGEECMLSMAVDITARQHAENERIAALTALRDSEERFRRALENIPDVVVIYDPDLRIRYINSATRRLTGRPVAEFIGRRDDEIWPPEIYSTYLPTLRRALDTRQPVTMVAELDLPGSGNRHLQIACVPLLDEQGAVREILGITHDFTARQQAAEALRHYAERLKVLHEVGRASLAGQPPQNIAEITLDLLQRLLPYRRGTITWINSQTQDAVGISRENDRAGDIRRHPSALSGTLEQLTINVPLQSRAELIGTLNLQADRLVPFTTLDVEIAHEAADELALAIQHAQLFEQVKTGRDRMERLSRRLLDVQETERRAIARELHDEIGQALTAVKIELQGIQRHIGSPTAEQLTDSIDLVDQALQQVRDLSLDLRPSLLDDLGLPAALRWYVDRQVQRAGLEAQLNVETVRERLAPNIETVCFRVVQEAVTNIIRHAHAQRVYVELIRHETQLWLTIQDDGRGFEVSNARARAAAGTSLGLLGMEERIWLSGGEIEIESTSGRGTTVRARLPFRKRDDLDD